MALDRRRYRELFGILRDAVTEAGYSVTVRYYSRKQMRAHKSWYWGSVDEEKRRVRLHWVRGLSSGSRLFIFAHEVRHVMHAAQGLLSAQRAAYDAGDKAWAAVVEADCDRWAAKFLASHGVSGDYTILMNNRLIL